MRIMAALLLASLPGVAGAGDVRVSVTLTIVQRCQVSANAPGAGPGLVLLCNGATEPSRRRVLAGGGVATFTGAPFARITANRDDKVLRVEF